MVYFLVQELYEVLTGNGKIRMVETVVEAKLMKYKTGLQLVHVQRLTLFGIMALKICTESALREWFVL